MRPKGSADVLEVRRRRALKFLTLGLSMNEVGRKLGCAASSVMRWNNLFRRGGSEALRPRSSPGRPRKLNIKQERRLVKELLRGPEANGYRTNLWTTLRISEVVKRLFGVEYHRNHVARMMHRLGWSHQKPERRAMERDETEIERWKREEWPRIKKTLAGWRPISYS